MSEQAADALVQLQGALDRLACVADATIVEKDPAGRTLEMTTEPEICGDHLPVHVALTVYREGAPWFRDVGIVEVSKRSPREGHWQVLVR